MYNLGIDLGGMSVKVGVVDENNSIIGKAAVPTNSPNQPPRPADDIMDDIATACHLAVENAGVSFDDVENIGLGCPGSVNSATGMLEFSGNLGMKNYPVAEKLKEARAQGDLSENAEYDAAKDEQGLLEAEIVEKCDYIELSTSMPFNQHYITMMEFEVA